MIKMNLLKAGIFPGREKDFYLCSSLQSDCLLLKLGIQHLMDNQEILFEKTLVIPSPVKDIAIITISVSLSKVSKRPVKITFDPKIVPLKITMSGPIPYKSNKSIPWNYGERSSTTVLNKLNRLKRVLMKRLPTLETLSERVKSPAVEEFSLRRLLLQKQSSDPQFLLRLLQ